ncbi:hypothetical protein [Pedobacter ginsengisoli]|uniref:hypothetical protein n=1 Tax=Pedobacter ginsengisoli TaxID=363852 RepID=UPI002550A7E0|nr:hypothetical protein [Pedobacter ginsengisoli]
MTACSKDNPVDETEVPEQSGPFANKLKTEKQYGTVPTVTEYVYNSDKTLHMTTTILDGGLSSQFRYTYAGGILVSVALFSEDIFTREYLAQYLYTLKNENGLLVEVVEDHPDQTLSFPDIRTRYYYDDRKFLKSSTEERMNNSNEFVLRSKTDYVTDDKGNILREEFSSLLFGSSTTVYKYGDKINVYYKHFHNPQSLAYFSPNNITEVQQIAPTEGQVFKSSVEYNQLGQPVKAFEILAGGEKRLSTEWEYYK